MMHVICVCDHDCTVQLPEPSVTMPLADAGANEAPLIVMSELPIVSGVKGE